MGAHKVFNLTRFSSWILAYTIALTQDIWLLLKFWSTWYWFFYKKHDQYLLKYHQLWFIMCTIASFCPHFHWSFSMHVQGSVILWSVMHIECILYQQVHACEFCSVWFFRHFGGCTSTVAVTEGVTDYRMVGYPRSYSEENLCAHLPRVTMKYKLDPTMNMLLTLVSSGVNYKKIMY